MSSRNCYYPCLIAVSKLPLGRPANGLAGSPLDCWTRESGKGTDQNHAGQRNHTWQCRRIIEESRVREIHASLGSYVASPMRFRNPQIAIGEASECEYQRLVVLEEDVRNLCRAVSSVDEPL